MVTCPSCGERIALRENARPGDTLRCCDTDYVLTLEYGSYALTSPR